MIDTVVIGGEISLSHNIIGECALINCIDGEIGTFMPIVPNPYTGELVITPKANESQTLACANRTMPGDVVVLEVPYWETHNTDGLTAYIASEV